MRPDPRTRAQEPSWDECVDLLKEFPRLPAAKRTAAIERLVRSQRPGVREQALRMGVAVMSDDTLVGFLRSDSDAVLRNAALEILKLRGRRSFSLAAELLADLEPDVVLQGVLILDHLKDPRAVEPLRSVLHHADPNVEQAAIVAIGHLGDARTIPDLLPFLESETWLQVAAMQALGDLRSPRAIAPLRSLLDDPVVGFMAAEAMAQIGGPEALAHLAGHWLANQDELDPEATLGLLAHVLEGLDGDPEPSEELRRSLAARLRDPFRGVRESASRCLLALGSGLEDSEALSLLAGAGRDPEVLPSCLARRHDLIDTLLEKAGVLRSWGFLLSSRFPEAAASGPLERALGDPDHLGALRPIIDALGKLRGGALARPLLNLYLSLPYESRQEMLPALERHGDGVRKELASRRDIGSVDRVVLGAALGENPVVVARDIVALAPDDRLESISQLVDRRDVMAALPWQSWLAEDPGRYLPLASRAAAAAVLPELLPLLRVHIATAPCPELIRAVGELEDADSVEPLLELRQRRDLGHLRPFVLTALGRIGGGAARMALRAEALSDNEKDSRLGFRTLAACATEEDAELFRQAAGHPDWLVRLAAVEVLARSAADAHLTLLSSLAADPLQVLAQSALETLPELAQ